MTGIRTSAAAELLGVSPSTLRSWERRLGFPHPGRTPGNHRQYDLGEVEALRDALSQTGNISSAVAIARARGRGPTSPARLLRAFHNFDDAAADRELEESIAMRSLERTVVEVLLPALEMAAQQASQEAELEHACRWATGWLHGARRLAPAATRDEGVLLLDSGSPLGLEAIYVQALELFLRRSGLRVLLLSAGLAESRFRNALRALQPTAIVLCGGEANIGVVGASLRSALASTPRATLAGYRTARLVTGTRGFVMLGDTPSQAITTLLTALDAPSALPRSPAVRRAG